VEAAFWMKTLIFLCHSVLPAYDRNNDEPNEKSATFLRFFLRNTTTKTFVFSQNTVMCLS